MPRILRAVSVGIALLVTALVARSSPAPEQRADELLSRMTLDEKVGQMVQADMNALKDKADVQKYFLGSVLSGGGSDPADNRVETWRKAVEEFAAYALKTRLQIPLIYGVDAVHGHNNIDGAVVFPHNIGLGATRNPALVEKAARVTAREMLGTGIRWAFAPCVAVVRDERWGRTYESFGESPELVSELGVAAIRGLQGSSLSEPTSVLACAKHYLGDGGTRDGVDQGNVVCDEVTLRKLHLAPYAAAVKAGVGSVMVSYSSWNGAKMHGNQHLITDVLKGELGFQGLVVSDWAGIDQLSPDYKVCIETAINAGLDMVMIPNGPGQRKSYVDFIRLTKELVAEGKIAQSRIDDAVRRILRVKAQMGLFDRPEVAADPKLTAAIGAPEHRQVARECVRQSLVLLKNSQRALPLSKQAKRLHVAGQAADDLGVQCGGWTVDWQGRTGAVTRGGTTILSALRQAVGSGTEVTYSADASGAKGADAVIVVVGEPPYAEGRGDRRDLSLTGEELALVARAREAGAPVVTVLLSGRPLVLGNALEQSDAFIAAWLPGTEGQGVADVLFGDCKPTGKLPRSWPRSNDQLPGSTARDPLFPFGYGLSY